MGLQLSQCHSPFHGDVAVPRKILLGHRLDPATIESLECKEEGVGVIKESFWPGNEIQKHDNTAHVLNAAQLEVQPDWPGALTGQPTQESRHFYPVHPRICTSP